MAKYGERERGDDSAGRTALALGVAKHNYAFGHASGHARVERVCAPRVWLRDQCTRMDTACANTQQFATTAPRLWMRMT